MNDCFRGLTYRANRADRVETLVAAQPDAISIRLDVLSEFTEPGKSVCEDLSNAVTLDDVSELISCGVQAWLLDGASLFPGYQAIDIAA